MNDRVGEQIGEYRLRRWLGGGGFGDVYLAENIYTKHLVAIKIPTKKIFPEAKELFTSEARTIAQLKHPNIARLLHFGIEGDTPYLVIEYAKHGSLRDRHPKGTQLDLATVISYVKQIAAALQYAHQQGTVHRDIKPHNFLLGEQEELLLSDFGIAITTYSLEHRLQIPIGTLYYMAPEQTGGKARTASDQYSLAITIYEWLCGTVPFKGTRFQIEMQHESVPPRPLHSSISIAPAVEEAILKALAKEPEQRFQSVQEFAQTLEQAYQGQISSLLKESEFTADMLRQEHFQQMLFDLIITNPKWWNDSGRSKIASLHMQADAKPSLGQSIKGALNALATKAVDRVIASIERKDWEGCDNLLHLISEAVPPSTDPNTWISLLESLSTKPKTMQALLSNWKVHSWLLEHWGSSSVSTGNKHIRSWFPTTWPELWLFMRLALPEEWYDVALTHLLDTTATTSLPPSVVRSIERDHRSALENYMRRSFSTYPYRITTVRLFAKLVESGYTQKMELLSILLSASDVPQNERQDHIESVLTAANLTREEITIVLEQQWSQLKPYSHLPKVSDYIGLYLLAVTLKDLDRPSTRQFLQFLHSSSSISLSQQMRILAESWFTISTFLEKPTISKQGLASLASAINQLPPAIHGPLLDKLNKLFIACINSEVDLLYVTEAMSTVLEDPERLRFLHRLAELVGEEYQQKRSETFLVPYIQIALQAVTVFQSMSNTEQDEFMNRFLDMLLRYADKQTYKKLKIITKYWPPHLSAKWHTYATTHNRQYTKVPWWSGGILQFFRTTRRSVFPQALASPRNLLLLALVILVMLVGIIGAVEVHQKPGKPFNNATATVDAFNATATAQAQATASAQAQATASVVAANRDPYGAGGTLALDDPLRDNSNGNGWDESTHNFGSCQFVGGAYHATNTSTQFYEGCNATPNFNNFAYQVQMTIIKGDDGGIVFRINEASDGTPDGYVFRVGQDGSYDLYVCPLNATKCSSPLSEGSIAAIKQGLNQTNLVAVIVKGNTITLYVNRQQIGSVTDNTFSHGSIGVIASNDISNLTEVVYSNAKVWTF